MSGTGIPRWVRSVHCIILHGSPDKDDAERLRLLWERHILDWIAENDGSVFGLVVVTLRGAISHVIDRTVRGSPTALPAGFFLVPLGLSSASIAFSGVSDEIPAWTHLLLGTATLAVALVIIGSPTTLRPVALSLGLLGMAAAGAIGLVYLEVRRPADIVLIGGWAVAILSIGVISAGLTVLPRIRGSKVARASWIGLAAGIGLAGLANIRWGQISTSPVAAVSCVVAGAAALLVSLSMWRISALDLMSNPSS